ncbi:MAG: DUF692 domain-containing protein [Deltaproteobacteria bacterium]|nr:DUF692 domain-containing protein [Deltaproteobacteria bacterium]
MLRDGKPQSLFPRLGFGLGLRSEHYRDVLDGRSSPANVAWFEVVSENYMGDGGRPQHVLEKVRAERPIVFHGVSLSIGSVDPLCPGYLEKLKALVDRFEPAMVSDHLCWTSNGGQNLHDLLPLPYTREAADHVVERVQRVQDKLKRRILLENVSSYLTFEHSEMEEWEFLTEIATRADCGLLLDVNNVYVSAINHGFDPLAYLDGVPAERVGQFHLAGHSTNDTGQGLFLIDTHDHPVCDEVWSLYGEALKRFGLAPTMIEWDANIPDYARLEAELGKAREIAAAHERDPAPARRLPASPRKPASAETLLNPPT